MAVLRGDELNISTYTSRQRFFQRTTGLAFFFTDATATEKFDDDYCGHSRGPTEDHESFGVERLHPGTRTGAADPLLPLRLKRSRSAMQRVLPVTASL